MQEGPNRTCLLFAARCGASSYGLPGCHLFLMTFAHTQLFSAIFPLTFKHSTFDNSFMSIDTLTPAQQLAALETVQRFAHVIAHGTNPSREFAVHVRQSATPDSLLARLAMSEAVLRGPNIFSDPLAKHDYITGRASRARAKSFNAKSWSPSPRKPKEMNLIFPARMPGRVIDANGGRSFHMRDTTVRARGSLKSSQAKVRQDYTLDGSKVPIVDACLAQEALERGLYLFRDSSTPHGEGIRLALTNMGSGDAEVIEAWQLIGRNEIKRIGKPIARHITIDHSKTPAGDQFWTEAAGHPDAPEGLREDLWNTEIGGKATFWDDDAKAIECFLRKRGWDDRAKAKRRPDVTFHRGRAPVIQRRLVFELPRECDLAEIERIISKLAQEFKRRNLPFVLVVHRPDAYNHRANWHLHLDYHHRPMQRFYASSFELSPLPPDAGTKQLARHRLAAEALANALPDWEGMWDCEIEYTYRTRSGKKKTCKPFLQDTHADLRDDWHKSLRSRFADIVNDELEGLGVSERFDPRTFKERGIEKEAEVHLGLSASRAERQGRPTLSGAANEQKQYDYEVAELKKKHPGGDTADGDPKFVAAYVADSIKLIGARLVSRAEFMRYYAWREIDGADGANPTATSRNERKTGNKEALRRVDEAEKALVAIGEIFAVIVRKAVEAARGVVLDVDKEISPAAASNATVPIHARSKHVTQHELLPGIADAPNSTAEKTTGDLAPSNQRHSKLERTGAKPAGSPRAASQRPPVSAKTATTGGKANLPNRNPQPTTREKRRAEQAQNALLGLRAMGAGGSGMPTPSSDKRSSSLPTPETAIAGGGAANVTERNVTAKNPSTPSRDVSALRGGSTPNDTGVSKDQPPAVEKSSTVSAVASFVDNARRRKVGVRLSDDGFVRPEGRLRDPAFEAELIRPYYQAQLRVIAEEQDKELLAIGKVAENDPEKLRHWADQTKRHPELPEAALAALEKWSCNGDVIKLIADLVDGLDETGTPLHHRQSAIGRSDANDGDDKTAKLRGNSLSSNAPASKQSAGISEAMPRKSAKPKFSRDAGGNASAADPEPYGGQQPHDATNRPSVGGAPKSTIERSDRTIQAKSEATRGTGERRNDGSPATQPSGASEMLAEWRTLDAKFRALLDDGTAQGSVRRREQERDRLAYALRASIAEGELKGSALRQGEERELEMQARRHQMKLSALGAQQAFGR